MTVTELIDWYKNRIKVVGYDKAFEEFWNKGFNRTLTNAIARIAIDKDGNEKILPQDI